MKNRKKIFTLLALALINNSSYSNESFFETKKDEINQKIINKFLDANDTNAELLFDKEMIFASSWYENRQSFFSKSSSKKAKKELEEIIKKYDGTLLNGIHYEVETLKGCSKFGTYKKIDQGVKTYREDRDVYYSKDFTKDIQNYSKSSSTSSIQAGGGALGLGAIGGAFGPLGGALAALGLNASGVGLDSEKSSSSYNEFTDRTNLSVRFSDDTKINRFHKYYIERDKYCKNTKYYLRYVAKLSVGNINISSAELANIIVKIKKNDINLVKNYIKALNQFFDSIIRSPMLFFGKDGLPASSIKPFTDLIGISIEPTRPLEPSQIISFFNQGISSFEIAVNSFENLIDGFNYKYPEDTLNTSIFEKEYRKIAKKLVSLENAELKFLLNNQVMYILDNVEIESFNERTNQSPSVSLIKNSSLIHDYFYGENGVVTRENERKEQLRREKATREKEEVFQKILQHRSSISGWQLVSPEDFEVSGEKVWMLCNECVMVIDENKAKKVLIGKFTKEYDKYRADYFDAHDAFENLWDNYSPSISSILYKVKKAEANDSGEFEIYAYYIDLREAYQMK